MSTTISIVSGKGGVGKSVIAVNLAETWITEGRSVALVDADLGQSACATLLNEAPRVTAADNTADHRACWHPCTTGLTLVQAASEPPADTASREGVLRALEGQLDRLRAVHDFIILDAPAGADAVVRWTLQQADLAALVLADEPTAVADAYRLAKMTWQSDPAYRFGAVVNFVETDAHGRDVWQRFSLITRRFTGNGSFYLGSVPFSTDVRRSVATQSPFVRQHQTLAASVQSIANAAAEHCISAKHGLSLQ